MLILIDHANVDSIAKTLEYLPIDGVTTNPTILYREGKEPLEVLHSIKSLLPDGAQLHVQIVSQRASERELELLTKLRGDVRGAGRATAAAPAEPKASVAEEAVEA